MRDRFTIASAAGMLEDLLSADEPEKGGDNRRETRTKIERIASHPYASLLSCTNYFYEQSNQRQLELYPYIP